MRWLVLAMLLSGCTYARITYPVAADKQAPSWVCTFNPRDLKELVCWDARTIFQQSIDEARERTRRQL
jgi:hypothetical protein